MKRAQALCAFFFSAGMYLVADQTKPVKIGPRQSAQHRIVCLHQFHKSFLGSTVFFFFVCLFFVLFCFLFCLHI